MIKKSKKGFLRKILGIFFYPHRQDYKVAITLDTVSLKLSQHTRVLLVGGALILIATILAFPAPLLTGYILDTVIPRQSLIELFVIGTILIVCLFVRSLLQYCYGMLFFTLTSKMILFLRAYMFKKFCSNGYERIQKYNNGYIISRLQDDPQRLALLFGDTIVSTATNFMTLCVGIVVMLYFGVTLTLITVSFLGILLFVMHYYGVRIRNFMEVLAEKAAQNLASLQENVSIMPLTSQYKRRIMPVRRYIHSAVHTLRYFIKMEELEQKSGSVMSLLSGSIPFIMLIVCGVYIIHSILTIGQFVAFMGIVGIIIGPAYALIGVDIELQKVIVGLKRVGEILTIKDELIGHEPVLKQSLKSVDFSNVTFSYDTQLVLQSVDVSFQKNKCYAIAGVSGSGKSTLAKIIAGFYTAEYELFLDGVLLTRKRRSCFLRQNAILIDQETLLFSGSVRDNLLLGNSNASDDELIQALIKAQAYDFMFDLPKGLDTEVEAKGANFSVGQRQRLAIARALLAKPSILIVDESTANVDNISEKLIYDALFELSEKMIIVVIAHRLESLKDFDVIYWLQDGAISEKGSHSELLDLGGLYAQQYLRTAKDEYSRVL